MDDLQELLSTPSKGCTSAAADKFVKKFYSPQVPAAKRFVERTADQDGQLNLLLRVDNLAAAYEYVERMEDLYGLLYILPIVKLAVDRFGFSAEIVFTSSGQFVSYRFIG